MSTVNGGMDIITNDLVLYLDTVNPKSYVSGSTSWSSIIPTNTTASLQNGVLYSNEFNGILSLDGIDDRVVINYSFPNTFSIDMWFFINGIGNYFMLNNLVFFGGVSQFGANPFFWHTRTPSNVVNDLNSSLPYISNRFNNITLTCNYDGSNYIKSIYMNGRLGGSSTVAGINLLNSTYPFYYACSSTPNVASKTQTIKIYHTALTAAEVLQNYNATKGRFGL